MIYILEFLRNFGSQKYFDFFDFVKELFLHFINIFLLVKLQSLY